MQAITCKQHVAQLCWGVQLGCMRQKHTGFTQDVHPLHQCPLSIARLFQGNQEAGQAILGIVMPLLLAVQVCSDHAQETLKQPCIGKHRQPYDLEYGMKPSYYRLPNCLHQSTDPVGQSRYDCLQAKSKGAVTSHSFDLVKSQVTQHVEAINQNTAAVFQCTVYYLLCGYIPFTIHFTENTVLHTLADRARWFQLVCICRNFKSPPAQQGDRMHLAQSLHSILNLSQLKMVTARME